MTCLESRTAEWPEIKLTSSRSIVQYQPLLLYHHVTSSTVCKIYLLARLMGRYCFARWRLSASSVIVCNTAGRRVGGQAKHMVGRVAHTAWQASTVTSH